MKFSKKVVIGVLVTVLAFTITMIVIFCIYQSVPDQFILAFYGFCGIEGGILGWIKKSGQ